MTINPITVNMTVSESTQQFNAVIDTSIRPVISAPPYEGEYTVTPTDETQTLVTTGKLMTDDVTVNPITIPFAGGASF